MAEETSGSSEKYSKFRPQRGERLMLAPGPSSTLTPSARDSTPSATPTRSTSAGSQVDARVDAVGKHVAGRLAPMASSSVAVLCRRTPCGPSVRTMLGTPSAPTPCIDQKSRPASSSAFSATDAVRIQESVPTPPTLGRNGAVPSDQGCRTSPGTTRGSSTVGVLA